MPNLVDKLREIVHEGKRRAFLEYFSALGEIDYICADFKFGVYDFIGKYLLRDASDNVPITRFTYDGSEL